MPLQYESPYSIKGCSELLQEARTAMRQSESQRDSGRYNDKGMDTYTLASKARPRLQDGQETRLYDVIEELGGGPVTLTQIVKQCEYRRYGSLLKTEPSIENSAAYHLRNWIKRGIVAKATASSDS